MAMNAYERTGRYIRAQQLYAKLGRTFQQGTPHVTHVQEVVDLAQAIVKTMQPVLDDMRATATEVIGDPE